MTEEEYFEICMGCDSVLSDKLDDIYHVLLMNNRGMKFETVLCESCAKLASEGVLEDIDGNTLELIDFTYVSLA